MMIRSVALIIFAQAFTLGSLSAQFLVDGFPKEKGDVTIAQSIGYASWDKYYAFDKKVDIAREATVLNSYLSVNPIKSLRVAASVPHIKVKGSDIQSFQDVFIQAQWMPLNKNGWSAYAIFGYGAPLATYETEIEKAIGQRAVIRSYGIGGQYTASFWFANVAYQHQEKNTPTPNAKQLQLKAGLFKNNWFVAAQYDKQYSIGGSDYRDGTFRPFTTLGSGYDKVGVNVYRKILQGLGASLGFYQTVNGRNVGNTSEVYFSVIGDFTLSRK